MVDDRSKFEQSMNSALDHELSEEELHALQEQVEESPAAADNWKRLRQVDALLRSLPLAVPADSLAGKVMAAIAAQQIAELARRRHGLGLALGLVAAALLTVPLLSALVLLLVSTITNPGTIAAILQGAAAVTSYVVDLVADLGRQLRSLASDTPALLALLTAVIPMSMLWGWLVWYLLGGSRLAGDKDVL
ncbi:MAG: hypothetical protein GXY36_03360 [Chloroflexi bacterium]|nr:hypothetical protein [Chloroflexota bacterium]